MKQVFFVLLSIVITHCALAQGITKNGKVTNTGTEYVNKNGAVGSTDGVDKNGRIVAAVSLPVVTTAAISISTTNAASSGGTITSPGSSAVIARGICWGTTSIPTIELNSKTNNGTGTGNFTSNMTGLSITDTYYVRAYATNSDGTAYGNELSFRTINIGDSYQGGIIAYIMTAEEVTAASLDPGLPHGFVISDQLGTGLNWYSAYDLCQNYSNGGFDDWSIPSESQLLKLYDNKDIIGSTLIANWVWGAEYEYATSKAYQVHMGFKFEAVVGKIDHTGEVYAVRSF